MNDPAYPDALPAHSRLHWYVVEKVLGQGGFGITYLARDTNLDQPVAIKEYLPVEVATRLPDATIRARTQELRDRYRWGLERFIEEARTLARFDHRNVVRVHSVFEMNGTAYMVMRFETGVTLAAVLDRRGTLPEDDLLGMLLPILDGLALVHQAGFIHRDIKPDNIHIGADGTPVLLDFGSARQTLGSAATLTILVAPGYAPFEQYYSDSASQGPWTDIYALGATCYRAIAGRAPLDAVSRSKGILGSTQDVMVAATIIGAGRYSSRVLAAIDHALAFSEKDRPQSTAEWREQLTGERMPSVAAENPATLAVPKPRDVVTAAAPAPIAVPPARSSSPPPPAARPASPARFPTTWVAGGALLAAIAVVGYFVMQSANETRAKLAQLETQLQEKERAAQRADTERAAKQKADEEARARQQQEQQARSAQEQALADAARKREADAHVQAAEGKRRDAVAPARAAAPRTPPATPPVGAPAAAARSSAATPSAPASMPASAPMSAPGPAPLPPAETVPAAGIVPAVVTRTEPGKPLPQPSKADELADAERALAAGKDGDALAVLKSLAEGGYARAQLRLGDLYAEGRGTPRDAATAQTWYERAALQGDTAAQVRLGAMYAGAGGSARSNNLAYVWYGTAARLGTNAATAERDRIGAMLQPAERAQADRLIESNVTRMKKAP